MKKILLSFLLMLLPLLASAETVKIDGIWYNLVPKAQEAEVTKKPNSRKDSGSYSGSIEIPPSVTYNKVEYSVTSIGDYAFSYSYSLTSVTIPNSVTSIGDHAFGSCGRLTSVTIPNSVTSIGDYAFIQCSGVISMIVEDSNPKYDSRNNCNAIIETLSNTLIAGCMNTTIPNSVTSIGSSAFDECHGLTSITIPNSVTSIGSSAFQSCTSLTSINIPNSVTSIGAEVFKQCNFLTSIDIPNSITSIGDGAFAYCNGLTSIDIPNSVTSIGDYAFSNCTSFTSIAIGNSVKSIGDLAFGWCAGLTSVTIGNSVTSIGRDAFFGCDNMKDIYCLAKNLSKDIDGNYEGLYTFPNAFSDYIVNSTLHVPAGSIDEYKSVEPWCRFGIIVALTNDDPISTGILRACNPMNESEIYYDLNGRKVVPYKGIYIHNGKKILKQ